MDDKVMLISIDFFKFENISVQLSFRFCFRELYGHCEERKPYMNLFQSDSIAFDDFIG